jgi:hypothetical protein
LLFIVDYSESIFIKILKFLPSHLYMLCVLTNIVLFLPSFSKIGSKHTSALLSVNYNMLNDITVLVHYIFYIY